MIALGAILALLLLCIIVGIDHVSCFADKEAAQWRSNQSNGESTNQSIESAATKDESVQ